MNEQNSNKSGTIEMYAPSSYNETMTGETLSSVSEKSETYSDTRQDYVSFPFDDVYLLMNQLFSRGVREVWNVIERSSSCLNIPTDNTHSTSKIERQKIISIGSQFDWGFVFAKHCKPDFIDLRFLADHYIWASTCHESCICIWYCCR